MKPLIGITADMDERILRLKHSYVSAIIRAGGIPLVLAPVSDDIPRLAEIVDGLMVPGGGDLLPEFYNETLTVPPACMEFTEKARTDFELSLLLEIYEKRKPILGICYGMQLINVMFGGSLYQDVRHQVSGALEHKNAEHAIKVKYPFPPGMQQMSVTVNSNHHQAVRIPGNGLEVFAVAEDGIIEGFYREGYPFLAGAQWHVEQGCDTLSLKMLALFIEKAKAKR